jgi:hypothetical protein
VVPEEELSCRLRHDLAPAPAIRLLLLEPDNNYRATMYAVVVRNFRHRPRGQGRQIAVARRSGHRPPAADRCRYCVCAYTGQEPAREKAMRRNRNFMLGIGLILTFTALALGCGDGHGRKKNAAADAIGAAATPAPLRGYTTANARPPAGVSRSSTPLAHRE